MAEARLRDRISETANAPPRVAERTTVGDAGRRRIKELARKGRKVDTTLANYESEIRVHFEPHFGDTPISQLDADDVEGFLMHASNADQGELEALLAAAGQDPCLPLAGDARTGREGPIAAGAEKELEAGGRRAGRHRGNRSVPIPRHAGCGG